MKKEVSNFKLFRRLSFWSALLFYIVFAIMVKLNVKEEILRIVFTMLQVSTILCLGCLFSILLIIFIGIFFKEKKDGSSNNN